METYYVPDSSVYTFISLTPRTKPIMSSISQDRLSIAVVTSDSIASVASNNGGLIVSITLCAHRGPDVSLLHDTLILGPRLLEWSLSGASLVTVTEERLPGEPHIGYQSLCLELAYICSRLWTKASHMTKPELNRARMYNLHELLLTGTPASGQTNNLSKVQI